MAIYKLDPATGIETVSGAISRHRLPDGSVDGSVEAWIMTKKGRIYHRVYRRTKPLSENEAIHRALFKESSVQTRQRMEAGDKRRYRDIFKEVYSQLKANIASASTKGQLRGK